MQRRTNGEWRYATLVLLLLVLAGVAAKLSINALANHPDLRQAENAVMPISVTIFSLTFGFLFLAGSFGIWAIRTTKLVEGRRSIGRFVDDMDYLNDALVAVDNKGKVTGMNPAARVLVGGADAGERSLRELFPCLSEGDLRALLIDQELREVERAMRRQDGALRGFRFRTQQRGEVNLVMVSDVTAARARQLQDLQSSHLQVVGRLARGVAHDFNNVLCAVSAHAAILSRAEGLGAAAQEGLECIIAQSARGAVLADRLIQLSRIDTDGEPARSVGRHVERAADFLRSVLDPAWSIDLRCDESEESPPVTTGNQLEQIILSIALSASDALREPGVLRIEAVHDPSPGGETDVIVRSVVLSIEAHAAGVAPSRPRAADAIPAEDLGVVASVIRSMLEDLGGRLHVFPAEGGCYAYRITLPTAEVARQRIAAAIGVKNEVRQRIEGRRVFLAMGEGSTSRDLQERLRAMGVHVESAHLLPDVLERMDSGHPPEAMVIDRSLLGGEPEALLRAIAKLHPESALVVRSENPSLDEAGLCGDQVMVDVAAAPDALIDALSDALLLLKA